jgi:hypothetical protein
LSAKAARRHAGHKQSLAGAAGIGSRALSSMHQQPPALPPVPHRKPPPQRAQTRSRMGKVGLVGAALMVRWGIMLRKNRS